MPLSKNDSIILKDINRTRLFCETKKTNIVFINEYKISMFRILSTIAHRREMGYCQGFNSIVSYIMSVMNFPNTINSRCLLNRLLVVNNKKKCSFEENNKINNRDEEEQEEDLIDNDIYMLINQTLNMDDIYYIAVNERRFGSRNFNKITANSSKSIFYKTPLNEATCFQAVEGLLELWSLDNSLYQIEQGHLLRHLRVFSIFLRQFIPRAYAILHYFQLSDLQAVVLPWFMTLFLNTGITEEILDSVWDQFILRGWKIVYKVSLNLIYGILPRLEEASCLEEVIPLFRNLKVTKVSDLLNVRYKITNTQIAGANNYLKTLENNIRNKHDTENFRKNHRYYKRRKSLLKKLIADPNSQTQLSLSNQLDTLCESVELTENGNFTIKKKNLLLNSKKQTELTQNSSNKHLTRIISRLFPNCSYIDTNELNFDEFNTNR